MPFAFVYEPPPTPFAVQAGADIEKVFYSAFTLLIYDHLLTLSEEVCTFIYPSDLFDKYSGIGPVYLASQVDYHQDCLSCESIPCPGRVRYGYMG